MKLKTPVTKKFMDVVSVKERAEQDGRLAHALMPDEVYRATPAVSISSLKTIGESPAKYKWHREHPSPSTPAQELGKAIHMALLEPELFTKNYGRRPSCDRRTKAGKEKFAEWQEANKGITALDDYDMDTVERVLMRAQDSDFFMQFFKPGLKEAAYFAKDEVTNLMRRGKIDNYVWEQNIIVDLKTTDCAAKKVFTHDIFKYQYFVQGAYYMDLVESATGTRPDAFAIVAVEKSRDCDMNVFYLSDKSLEVGREIYRGWLNTLAECMKTDKWPGYDGGFIEYNLPKWFVESVTGGDRDEEGF